MSTYCPECKSNNIKTLGRYNASIASMHKGSFYRYKCIDCNRIFDVWTKEGEQ